MKKSKLSETQIVSMLNEGEAGVAVETICRKYKVANSTYYKIKAKYAGMGIAEIKRLKILETENQRLKAMYAEISLEHKVLKDVLEKKFPNLLDEA